MKKCTHNDLANAIRFLSVDAVQKANSVIQVCRWEWQMFAQSYLEIFPFNPESKLENEIDLFCLQVMDQCFYTLYFIFGLQKHYN